MSSTVVPAKTGSVLTARAVAIVVSITHFVSLLGCCVFDISVSFVCSHTPCGAWLGFALYGCTEQEDVFIYATDEVSSRLKV